MKTTSVFLAAFAATAIFVTPAFTQDAEARAQAALALASVADLGSRVSEVERRLDSLDRLIAPAREASPKRSYADAYRQALVDNKPLVVWSGAAVCPACVAETEGEFVNYVGAVPGYSGADALVAYVPENGVLRRAGTITDWVVGDAVHGHVPSVRRAIQRWRESRQVTDTPAAMSYQQTVMAAPMMATQMVAAPMMSAPMMGGGMMMSAGGCASCGTAGRGLFRR